MKLISSISIVLICLATWSVSNAQETEENQQATVLQKPTLKSYSKYDFVPGEKVIFFEDFNQDAIGDFPARWNTNGTGEVVTVEGFEGKWFKMVLGGAFYPEELKSFPDNFTLEFDLLYQRKEEGAESDFPFELISWIDGEQIDGLVPGNGGYGITVKATEAEVFNWAKSDYGDIRNTQECDILSASANIRPVKVSVWVQKQRVRLYINEKKVFDVPRLVPAGIVFNRLRFPLWGQDPINNFYITNIRVAAGLPDMRSKLITEGKLITHGIYFDSGSDKVKPESYGTLKEIAAVLSTNPAVKVQIVGFTDSDGDDALNLDLSAKRAAAVKKILSSDFAIGAERMETKGKGESEPISPNTTSEGKANNRRVEFIKL